MAPASHIELDALDHIAAWNIPQSVIYLSLKQDVTIHDAFGRLQEGLRRTLAQIPCLNGRVHWRNEDTTGWRPGQLEIRYEPIRHLPQPSLSPLHFSWRHVSGHPAAAGIITLFHAKAVAGNRGIASSLNAICSLKLHMLTTVSFLVVSDSTEHPFSVAGRINLGGKSSPMNIWHSKDEIKYMRSKQSPQVGAPLQGVHMGHGCAPLAQGAKLGSLRHDNP
ncbi:hypothetical protein BDV38DRAFT_276750 [Aspergillus pseudotamarii]|uniref:Uncharacterized protein n=1 Tax=Aspergillus pseudotamarii TaxID=132259 RepID=A0A5N6TBB0_ASPPS|nr:uncharacterized protein BDV38DRAFT_276750 [Aspergillus pseudotamarii]KAE8143665.1 hypothetical protein BDV38DRAFT_276750 [Aspergillus pseudotamarii]